MTTPEEDLTEKINTFKNTAFGSRIGFHAGQFVLHTANIYQISPNASPREKYQVGVRYLEDGVPGKARELIDDAIAHEFDDGEVRFHWALAMLSKRSYRDLSGEDRDRVDGLSELLPKFADDEWKCGLEAICALLDHQNDSGADFAVTLTKLLVLPRHLQAGIVRHLDLVLTGQLKDELWHRMVQEAKDERFSADRQKRIWAYFCVAPTPARVRPVAPDPTTRGDRQRAFAWSGLLVIAVGYLGWSVLEHATPFPIAAFVLALAALCVAARTGLEWRYKAQRSEAKDRDYYGQRAINPGGGTGFASQVSRWFNYYVHKYGPDGVQRARFLADTVGIRCTLRDEIAEIYREKSITADQIRWLIRYIIRSEVRDRWKAGTLRAYRDRYRVTEATEVSCCLSTVVLVPAAVDVFVTAMETHALLGALATVLAVASGVTAATRWLRVIGERRRYAEEKEERAQLLAGREAAFTRWKAKLDATRPSESEMESWLTCDKTILLNQALHHYHLTWRDVLAYAFLQTPAKNAKRGRVPGGPMRYSKYDVRLFLMTRNGVREVTADLDFENVSFGGQERKEFGFDSICSVHVVQPDDSHCTLELTLVNGGTWKICVKDMEALGVNLGDDPETVAELELDAAGFTHALHLLEGIAADGKTWIDRGPFGTTALDGAA